MRHGLRRGESDDRQTRREMPFAKARGMKRRGVLAMLAAGGVALLGGCDVVGQSWSYRYKMTAVVEKDGQLYEGSSVIEIVRKKAGNGSIQGKARGQAVAVDIPSSGTLFLLLRGPDGGTDWTFTMPHHAFADRLGSRDMVNDDLLTKLENMQGESATLTPNLFPTLVRFRDVRDAKTVEEIDPNSLVAGFGPSVKLRGITVRLTGEDVTTGIEKRLPWLGTTVTGYLDGQFSGGGPALANILDTTDFKQGY